MSLQELSSRDAIAAIAANLHCLSDDIATQEAFAAEIIRGVLLSSAIHSSEMDRNVSLHTTRLLTSARKTLDLLWPQSGAAKGAGVAEIALKKMAHLGDVVDIGSGYWIAAPLRLVATGKEQDHLLIGGLPNAAVKAALGRLPTCASISRFVDDITPSSATLVQSLDDWFGVHETLQQWTERALEFHQQRMTSSDNVEADHLEIYVPDIFAAQRRLGRWMPAQQLPRALNEARLCRPLLAYTREWERPEYLAQFAEKAGSVVVVRSARIDDATAYRLRFGFDVRLNTKRSVTIIAAADTITFDLPYGLPKQESKIMALGWNSSSNRERYVFDIRALPLLMQVFAHLSIAVTVKHGT